MNAVLRTLSLSWRGLHGLAHGWWRLLLTCFALLVMLLTPACYTPAVRKTLARHIYLGAAPMLVGFSVLTATIAVMLTHIVVVTAHSYGLSQFALQVVIRVLVLELIPMTVAVFVALRCTIPDGVEVSRQLSPPWAGTRQNMPPVDHLVLPRLVAGLFAGFLLAALASTIALVVAYLVRYGFSLSGFSAFTRAFGQVLSPTVVLILVTKILLFGLTVSLIPMASALIDGQRSGTPPPDDVRSSAEMRALVRMAVVVLVIEIASLVGNYA